MDFEVRLREARISKAELARRLGITPHIVSYWKNKPQKYAIAYLDLLIRHHRVISLLERGHP